MPAALLLDPKGEAEYSKIDCILIRIEPEQTAETIYTLKSIWQKYRPNFAFASHFMEDDIKHQYKAERQWQQIIFYASLFAILIAALGIFGLASLTAARRRKEIGIRKVLGASVTQVLHVLTREFVFLFLLASIPAWLISFLVAHRFLQSFAYRTNLGLSDFFLGSFIVLAIAGAVVCSKTLKAALENPVNTIRYE